MLTHPEAELIFLNNFSPHPLNFEMESYASRSKQIHEDASLKLKSQTFAKFYAEIISAVTVI